MYDDSTDCYQCRDMDPVCSLHHFWDMSQVRPKKKKLGRHSGGITILVKSHLRKGIKVAHNSEGLLWFCLSKSFFNLKNDLYICATYIPPQYSSKSVMAKTDYFSDLLNTTNSFLRRGNVIVAGDLNARIGRENNSESVDLPCLEDILPHATITSVVPERSACDLVINPHGRKLLRMCSDLNLHVANGRTPGDLLGNFSCYTNMGSSTVDLVIADSQMINKIKQLKVLNPEYTSVHAPISFKIDCDLEVSKRASSIPLPPKIIWDLEKVPMLKEALASPNNRKLIEDLTKTLKDEGSPKESIDECLRGMNELLINEAKKCMKVTKNKPKQPPKKSKSKGYKWYNSECTNLKNRLQNQARLLTKNPKDSYILGQYNKTKKQYRKTLNWPNNSMKLNQYKPFKKKQQILRSFGHF